MVQIRIVTDTTDETAGANLKKRKKKKPHRGYAFVVFEREKDMKGNTSSPFEALETKMVFFSFSR